MSHYKPATWGDALIAALALVFALLVQGALFHLGWHWGVRAVWEGAPDFSFAESFWVAIGLAIVGNLLFKGGK